MWLLASRAFISRGLIEQMAGRLDDENRHVRQAANYSVQVLAKAIVEYEWSSCLETLEGYSGSVRSVAFSADGGRVASTSRTVKIWDVAMRALQGTLEGHRRGLCSVAFSANGARVASVSRDGTVKIWDAATGTLQSMLEWYSGWIESVAFSADDARVASASRDHTVKIWDVTTWTLRSTLKSHSNSVTSDYLNCRGKLSTKFDVQHNANYDVISTEFYSKSTIDKLNN
ncbi:hypothetical protein G3M48_009836 [Beauveria asiatica]|uniref:Vegetative incompatibility protein HET-E-1 n=1 Tax=Beauveria asiatica TaxID=1069075 RepID=A0AAW0RI09_9HYPO